MKRLLLIVTLLSVSFITGCAANAPEPYFEETVLFESGSLGYHTFRIPSIITMPSGTVLAFCEGRKGSRSDTGDIDMVMRRSTDGGRTWGEIEVIWDDGENVCGNPCPVVDSDTGVIWLVMTHNLGTDSEHEIRTGESEGGRTVWVMFSADDGVTWSKPADITATTKDPGWGWYATGPGIGIQLESGRLLIPCDYSTDLGETLGAHVIYSDDHGATWKLGGTVSPNSNESQAVELTNGAVLLNIRSYHGLKHRYIAISRDGGLTFGDMHHDDDLIEPVCQASIIRYTRADDQGRDRILFSNPADSTRVNMTVRLSYDECETWPVVKSLYEGPSAYSCLTVFPDMSIGCLYEKGVEHAYETIVLARFNLEWLTGGEDVLNAR